jgi:hypothetical protein
LPPFRRAWWGLKLVHPRITGAADCRRSVHTVRLMPTELCEGLSQAQQERCERYGGDLRGGDAALDACANEVRATQSALMSHRSRQLLVRQRTMLSNAIRGHMAELGIISAKGRNGMASCCSSLPMPRMIGWFGHSWFVARDIKEPTLLTRSVKLDTPIGDGMTT